MQIAEGKLGFLSNLMVPDLFITGSVIRSADQKRSFSKQNRLKSAIPIGAELRGITQIFETAILFQKKEQEYNSRVLNPCRNKKRWGIETIYRITDDLRVYTTSTNCVVRYFLFMFTCLVYNIWRFFKMYLGEDFTLANYKICMIIFMAKHGMTYLKHYNKLEIIAERFFNS